ncbi:hypothetical protein TWF225_000517 [Orbilia oligospora]|nr:hypothetical protein TWF225_000517 [Orbilia oligospora]KAF3264581.1 hypothetical protein TWF128_001047 [Orbilia oligospora]KAF3268371.1 hypothetical protein TWF217_010965 [Orbilia oligospora]KAF3290387.1 hypothetical protein TWF132_006954 [Orbilia oligospora]
MIYYREGTRCNFGPLNFTIGIKNEDGSNACAFYVNRDVFLALAPRFEQYVDEKSKRAGKEITEYFIPLDPYKAELMRSFAIFINEGILVIPQYEGWGVPDNLLFLYNFANTLGCSLMKGSIIKRMKDTVVGLSKEIDASAGKHRGDLEYETMDWINVFYECSTEAEVKEFKMWRLVEAFMGKHPWMKLELLGLRIEDQWDYKLRYQVLGNMRRLTESEIETGFSNGHPVRPSEYDYPDTRTEEGASDFESGDDYGEDYYSGEYSGEEYYGEGSYDEGSYDEGYYGEDDDGEEVYGEGGYGEGYSGEDYGEEDYGEEDRGEEYYGEEYYDEGDYTWDMYEERESVADLREGVVVLEIRTSGMEDF